MTESAATHLHRIWTQAGCDPAALGRIDLQGTDPILPTDFRLGTAAQVSIGAAALAAAELWRLRGGTEQQVILEIRKAAAAFRSERYLRVDGGPPADLWSPIAGFYRTGDDRWIQLHTNFPHHRDGVLAVLGCAEDRGAVQRAILDWQGQALEDALAAAGMCAGLVRAPETWQAHPQARAIARLPLFEIIKLADSPPEPLAAGAGPPDRPPNRPPDRPLAGLRVLDLTRIIAGPVCGRALAEHGAEVMRIAAPHLPFIAPLVIDSGRGKLSAHLDLREPAQAERLRGLVRQSDVFVQGYRPGTIAARGFGPDDLAALRPGIVAVSLSAYGHQGPWRDRRGFDSLVQSVSGIAWESGRMDADGAGPKHLPAQALDHATGYLAAFGALAALTRRATEGGSYLVRVSLAQTGRWIDGLGRVAGRDQTDPGLDDIRDLIASSDTPFGRVSHVVPAAGLSETPAYWARPAVPLGSHPPAWPGAR